MYASEFIVSSLGKKPTRKNSVHHNLVQPYYIKKRIVRCLQHQAKAMSSDTDAYQEEMKRLRDNFHRNN